MRTIAEQLGQQRLANSYIESLHSLEEVYRSGGDQTLIACRDFDWLWVLAHGLYIELIDEIEQDEVAAAFCKDIASSGSSLLSLRVEPSRRIPLIEKAIEIARKLDDFTDVAINLLNLGNAYAQTGRAAEAIALYEEVITLSRQHQMPDWEANALNNMGIAYLNKGQRQKASELHRRAMELANRREDRSSYLANLGSDYAKSGQYSQALQTLTEALEISRHDETFALIGSVLQVMSAVYLELERFDEALEANTEALQLATGLEDGRLEGICLGQMGNIYYGRREFQLARKFFDDALKVAQRAEDRNGEALRCKNLGIVYYQLHQPQESLQYSRRACELYTELGVPAEVEAITKFIQGAQNPLQKLSNLRLGKRNSS